MQDKQFDEARAKTMEAEQAARLAHANAEKALRLLEASEETSKKVAEARCQAKLRGEKLEDLTAAVGLLYRHSVVFIPTACVAHTQSILFKCLSNLLPQGLSRPCSAHVLLTKEAI